MRGIISFMVSVVFLVFAVYGVLYFLELEVGDFMDWVVGLASFLWLMVIVTVPWNAHFKAKEILDEAAISKRKDILVIESSLEYVQRVAKRSLFVAISLHIISAAALYFVASLGVSPIGYFGAVAALLLTVLRPSVRYYEYLQNRLREIRQEFRYPREDVQTLMTEFHDIKQDVLSLKAVLSIDPKESSWRKDVDKKHFTIDKNIKELTEDILERIQKVTTEFGAFKTETDKEFKVVKTESQQRYEKVATDSRVLDSVRVLAGFVKEMKGN